MTSCRRLRETSRMARRMQRHYLYNTMYDYMCKLLYAGFRHGNVGEPQDFCDRYAHTSLRVIAR